MMPTYIEPYAFLYVKDDRYNPVMLISNHLDGGDEPDSLFPLMDWAVYVNVRLFPGGFKGVDGPPLAGDTSDIITFKDLNDHTSTFVHLAATSQNWVIEGVPGITRG